jgi:ribosome modulation factor
VPNVGLAYMRHDPLRAAYDAGLKSGLEKGFPSACPFAVHEAMDQRFAWLSGFSVGKIVRAKKA